MEVTISAHQMELTPAMKNRTETSLKKIEKYKERYSIAEVHLRAIKHNFHVKIMLRGGPNHTISEATDSDSMYKAIDACVDKLETLLKKNKKDYEHTPLSEGKRA